MVKIKVHSILRKVPSQSFSSEAPTAQEGEWAVRAGKPSSGDWSNILQRSAFYFILFIYFKFYLFIFPFIFIHWRLITLQYCSGFWHTLTWISHGFTCVPHPDPLSRLPLHPIPLGLPSAPALSTHLMHPTWAGDLFHPWQYTCFNAVLSEHPTLAFSHRV